MEHLSRHLPTEEPPRKRILLSLFVLLLLLPPALSGQSPSPGAGVRSSHSQGYLGKITRRGVLVVGMQREYHPFHMDHPVNESYPGIDVELARRLADSLGVELRMEFHPLEELLRLVSSEKIDLALGGISGNLDRARTVNFSDPYVKTTPAALLARRVLPPESASLDFPRRKFESLSDLRYAGRLRLGVLEGTTNQQLLQNDPEFEKHEIVTFARRDELLRSLNDGEVDALVADGIYIRALLLKRPGLLSRFLPLTRTYREEHISMAIPVGHAEYLYYINYFIKEMGRTGVLDSLLKKYLESDDWVPK